MEWHEGDYAYFNPNWEGNDPPLLVQLIEQDYNPGIWKVKAIDYLHRNYWGGWSLGGYDENNQTFWTTDDLIGPAYSYYDAEIDVNEFL